MVSVLASVLVGIVKNNAGRLRTEERHTRYAMRGARDTFADLRQAYYDLRACRSAYTGYRPRATWILPWSLPRICGRLYRPLPFHPPTAIPPPMRILVLVLVLGLCACSHPAPEPPSQPVSSEYIQRGRALVTGLAACGFCHGQATDPAAPLSGGRILIDRFGEVRAPNLTPAASGLADWTAQDILRAIRSGVSFQGEVLSQDVHRGFEWMSDDDAFSIIAYVMAVPPVEQDVERRTIGFWQRNTTGFFVKAPDVRGSVPALAPRFRTAYGQYLTDHVARCGGCHNAAGGILGAETYLAGGSTIYLDGEEKLAPDISGSQTHGIGSWSDADIVQYLRTGTTPDKRAINPAFCPVMYYRNGTDAELSAMAAYLKTVPASD